MMMPAVRSSTIEPSDGPSAPLSLESLPDELLQLVVVSLSSGDLKNLALVSKCTYSHAIAPLWQNVCLIDTWKLHLNEKTRGVWTDRGQGEPDEHDDTPIIQKLYVLARNPFIASKVRVLTHRCHLPTPSIYGELPRMYFNGPNLSRDERLHKLLRLAIQNLVNVHTLRIIFGHLHVTTGLLEGFFDPVRPRRIPLRKLWLESCSPLGAALAFEGPARTPNGLESVRIRRLRFESFDEETMRVMKGWEWRLGRGGSIARLHNGAGGFYSSTVEFSGDNRSSPLQKFTSDQLYAKAKELDDEIWQGLPEVEKFIHKENEPAHSLRAPSTTPLLHVLDISASSLTKLNLDWILWRKAEDESADALAVTILNSLSKLRFPNLRAFQVRNAVVAPTRLPYDMYLLDSGIHGTPFLDFLEAHRKIQCLAWPLDRFYSHAKSSQEILIRACKLVAHFGNMLIDLRLDCYYCRGETFTDDSVGLEEEQERIRRRRFISEFAPYLTKVEQIKLEGGIPRDEKREILRALHYCPLKKIVLIGVSFPVGNTWGFHGEDLKEGDDWESDTDSHSHLEEEDKAGILCTYATRPTVIENFKFTPSFGWPSGVPFLHTIAAHHASTITELKICGYSGSPILSSPTPITRPLLYNLRCFHNLKQLVISIWLPTMFEGRRRDEDIIQSWMDTRSPSSTALVVVTPPSSPTPPPVVAPTTIPDAPSPAARPQEFNRWAVCLKTRYAPSALAYRVAGDIAPHLSNTAKERKGGVRVRASFCLGRWVDERRLSDIFDLDIRIGKGGQVLEFVGPREEGEKGRWWDKLESRRWF
ncbi:uncharacterized protein BDR25DRAFT_252277 [Lindgomyces ingoldianus]|uniref:Uncharacterized protein n=1 Tax=Lindgomyces ingoldianus TaxID=673940 RepID=A0ACB6RDE1_9PLEO|nr:uncharacterized protein BDR25DRAFT_252277 [Lindgomyces ingoldianus]KAF2476347.1 hypothetical protein BDR25DRAFT_252277 [Lindgomyces ingoldianus]